MQAGTALIGRRLLAAFVAVMLMASVMLLFADSSARASHEPPDDIVPQEQGSNDADYWEDYLVDVRNITNGTCEKIEEDDDDAWVMPDAPVGDVWVLLVVKQATTNFVYYDPVAGHTYPSTGDQSPGYSHIIVCSAPEPEDTTTTTEAEETTTTTEAEETTTTTEAEETTTTVEDTTTTTIEDEVLPTVITTSTTAAPATTVEDEVLGTEVLPFTGGDNDMLALLAGGLGLLGALVLASTRRMEEN